MQRRPPLPVERSVTVPDMGSERTRLDSTMQSDVELVGADWSARGRSKLRPCVTGAWDWSNHFGPRTVESVMASLLFDLRDAVRTLRRDRAYALTVILTPALTIGAT